MKLNEVAKLLSAQIVCGEEWCEKEVDNACGSDLMSDVLAFAKDHAVLLTGLVNQQVVRTAEMLDLPCVVFVRGKNPTDNMIELARESSIVLMKTEHRLYTACGILFLNGLTEKE